MRQFSFVIITLFIIGCSRSYYGIDNFGKLVINKDGTYNCIFHDVGADSGKYHIMDDTLFLTSFIPPVEYFSSDSLPDLSNFIHIEMRVYDFYENILNKDKNIFKDSIVILDANRRIYINGLSLVEGQMVQFYFFREFNFIATKDTTINGYFQLADVFGNKLYFNDYPLLIRQKYLLPCDRKSIKYFELNNNIELLPFKRGKASKRYKVFYSGFGSVESIQ